MPVLLRTRERRLEREVRRALRSHKVGILPDLLAEVLRAAREHQSTREVAMAYLITLANRMAFEQLSRCSNDTQGFVARQVGNLLRRINKVNELPALPFVHPADLPGAVPAVPMLGARGSTP